VNAISELDNGAAIGCLSDRESSIVGARVSEVGCKLPALAIDVDEYIHGGANGTGV
jgi:hypothetical protein